MVKTIFRVINLNPAFEFVNGFFLDLKNEGGADVNTDDDGADDVLVAANGINGNDSRGVWISLDNPFEVNGDAADATTPAGFLFNVLDTKEFVWTPNNPAYNTVSPYLKDGVTRNPDYDPRGNPIDVNGIPDAKVLELAKHFKVKTDVQV